MQYCSSMHCIVCAGALVVMLVKSAPLMMPMQTVSLKYLHNDHNRSQITDHRIATKPTGKTESKKKKTIMAYFCGLWVRHVGNIVPVVRAGVDQSRSTQINTGVETELKVYVASGFGRLRPVWLGFGRSRIKQTKSPSTTEGLTGSALSHLGLTGQIRRSTRVFLCSQRFQGRG